MDLIISIYTLCCLIGITTGSMPLGVIFVMSLIICLYCLLLQLQGDKLIELGLFVFVVGIVSLMYTSAFLFFGIDVKYVLGL